MANPNGTPIWFELNTPDQDKAQSFYEAVANWSFATSPMPEHGGYRMAGPDKAGVAGVMTPPPGTEPLPGWTIYFASDDVDAMAQRVETLGGKLVMAPVDIPHVGRFAILADPQGVMFNIMKGASPEDSVAFKPMAGEAGNGHGVWIELATPDPDGALDFYGKLFGWSKQGAMPMGEMGDYTFVGRSENDQPGAIMSSTATNAPARWSWYIQVPDIDAAVSTAQTEGGTVLQEPMEIPGGDYAANVIDAQGFGIGLVGPRKV